MPNGEEFGACSVSSFPSLMSKLQIASSAVYVTGFSWNLMLIGTPFCPY